MTFRLPKPPSTNSIYGISARGGFAKMYITAPGKQWFSDATLLIRSQSKKRKPIESPLEVCIELYTARRNDVDGVIKPILDLLQKAEVIVNDRQVYRVTSEIYRSKVVDEHVIVSLYGYAD